MASIEIMATGKGVHGAAKQEKLETGFMHTLTGMSSQKILAKKPPLTANMAI